MTLVSANNAADVSAFMSNIIFTTTVMKSDLKKIIEEIALKKIMHQFPEAGRYTSKIKFNHSAHKASMNLDGLPPALARQIAELFE